MTIPRINATIEGEIIGVQPRKKGERNSILYICRAMLPNGSIAELHNVAEASLFGGVGDYFRRRSRARSDAEYNEESLSQSDLDASVGERVYISFIGGSVYHPVIIGYKQHPNQVNEFEKPDEEKPNLVSQYNGLRETISDEGDWRITRKGAPEVKFEPKSGIPSGSSDVFDGDESVALVPKDESQRLIIEVLDKALFRVRDPEGGMIEIDHVGKKGIYLTNNDWKSSEDPDNDSEPSSGGLRADDSKTDAEYLWLNRDKGLALLNARKIAQIYSFDKRKDVTEGDHSHKVGKNSSWEITENLSVVVKGSSEETVESDKKVSVTGKFDINSTGNFTVDSKGDILLATATGAALSLKGGQIALGNPNLPAGVLTGAKAEIADILEKLLQTLAVEAPAGFGAPLIGVAQYNELSLLIATLKGSL